LQENAEEAKGCRKKEEGSAEACLPRRSENILLEEREEAEENATRISEEGLKLAGVKMYQKHKRRENLKDRQHREKLYRNG
jgi:hypothetical protein